jgi:flagellar basal-body rod modification protein FlgD
MAILGVAPTAGNGALGTSGGRQVSQLGSQDFLRLLIEQLRNQNPLDPVGGTDFLAQTAQFSSVENLNQVNTNISQLLTLQQVTQASGLIGKRISFQKAGVNGLQTATVSAVNITNGKVTLTAGADVIDLSQVRTIQAA